MSAEGFRRALNNIPQLKEWASGQRDTGSILHQTRSSSEAEIRNSTVDQIIPFDQLSGMLGESTARAIFNEIKTGKYITGLDDVVHHTEAGQETVIFKGLSFRRLNEDVSKYLEQIAKDANVSDASGLSGKILESVKQNKFDKGHVYGWANTLVQRTKGSMAQALKDPARQVPPDQLQKELDGLNTFIDSLLDILEEYDEATSNITGLKSKVFAKYRKTDSSWLIEWQSSAEQQGAGRRVGVAVGLSQNTGVKGYLKEVGYNNKSLMDKALRSMVDGFVKQGLISESSHSFLELESSPKVIELMKDTLVSAVSGKPKKYKREYTGTVNNAAELTLRKVVGAEKAKADVRKAKADLRKLKNSVNQAKRTVKKKVEPQTVNLVNLQALMNTQLQDVISANMGDGNRKDILNYRTGRFASTVNVDHLTMSRDGMISVFYNYMKYPYATFSSGGRQQNPKTRDPKLLISKSIREIAAEVVSNKLRAVSI